MGRTTQLLAPPLAPRTPIISPSPTETSTPSSARKGPYLMTSASVSSMRRPQILLDDALVLEDLGRRPVGDLLTGDQHHDAIGQFTDHPHRVLDDEDRAARFQLLQNLHHGAD